MDLTDPAALRGMIEVRYASLPLRGRQSEAGLHAGSDPFSGVRAARNKKPSVSPTAKPAGLEDVPLVRRVLKSSKQLPVLYHAPDGDTNWFALLKTICEAHVLVAESSPSAWTGFVVKRFAALLSVSEQRDEWLERHSVKAGPQLPNHADHLVRIGNLFAVGIKLITAWSVSEALERAIKEMNEMKTKKGGRRSDIQAVLRSALAASAALHFEKATALVDCPSGPWTGNDDELSLALARHALAGRDELLSGIDSGESSARDFQKAWSQNPFGVFLVGLIILTELAARLFWNGTAGNQACIPVPGLRLRRWEGGADLAYVTGKAISGVPPITEARRLFLARLLECLGLLSEQQARNFTAEWVPSLRVLRQDSVFVPDVFISYSGPDSKTAIALKRLLEEALGIEGRIVMTGEADSGLPEGGDLELLDEWVVRARTMIVLATKEGSTAPWVVYESTVRRCYGWGNTYVLRAPSFKKPRVMTTAPFNNKSVRPATRASVENLLVCIRKDLKVRTGKPDEKHPAYVKRAISKFWAALTGKVQVGP